MKLQEKNKSLEWKITGYEFPVFETCDKSCGYDANWLMVEITYTENGETQTHGEADILTWELLELAAGLSRYLYRSDVAPVTEFSFTEPFLFCRIERQGEDFRLEVRQVLDHAGSDNVLSASQTLSRSALSSVVRELVGFLHSYPQRW